MSETTIKRAMKNLIDKGIVITENFNKKKFDKTLWYSIDYEKLAENVEITDSVKSDYRLGQNDTTIVSKWTNYTNNNNNNKENNNINIITKERFKKPSLEEIEEYCKQRNSSVDPKVFYEYFETGNWIDSKGNKVKNWKQKIITWERNRKPKQEVVPEWFNEDLNKESEIDDETRRLIEEIEGTSTNNN